MNKQSKKSLPAWAFVVMACLLVILSFGHLLHDGGNRPAPQPQREGVVKWVVRTLAEAWLGNLFRSEPPPANESGGEQLAGPLAGPRLYMAMPTKPPAELMQADGADCRHAEGW